MNNESKELTRVLACFPKAFVNRSNEMIIYPRTNTFFMLDNVATELELDCKVLEFCSGAAINGSWQSKKYHFDGICAYFGFTFTKDEMERIYARLGNGVNRALCVKFIESGFDMGVLEDGR